jgi:hypothetical protein
MNGDFWSREQRRDQTNMVRGVDETERKGKGKTK